MKKLLILFRWSSYNHYSVSYLTGLLDEFLDERCFTVCLLKELKELPAYLTKSDLPVVAAYSFTSPEFTAVSREIKHLKKLHGNNVIVICGGSHTTAKPDEVLQAGADIVFTGESEESLLHFLNCLYNSRAILKTKLISPIPLKDFNLYPPFAYKRKFFNPIELRRGCRNNCSFCHTPGLYDGLRERSIEYVLTYAQIIKNSGRTNIFFIISDVLSYGSSQSSGCNLQTLEQLLKTLHKTGLNIHLGSFPSEVSPHTLSDFPEAGSLLKEYVHNKFITIGGQSGSDQVLQKMKRDHSVQDTINAVKTAYACAFKPVVDIMFGIPGESRDDRLATLSFIKKTAYIYKARFNIHYFIPLPGTAFENHLPENIEQDIKEEIAQLMKKKISFGDFFAQLDYADSVNIH
ncbi:MAG: TIGR04013 family B12-binding domain/radical SAM domain-containing protein [bacterium]